MNTSREDQQIQQFQEIIEQCNSLLSTMDTCQLNALIERFSAEIDSRRTLNYLVDGPSLLSCLISRHIVRPDNLTALITVAEVADRSDIKQSIDNYYPSSLLSHQSKDSLTDDAFTMVTSSIQHDWRRLARQLALAELDIVHINASTSDNESAASQMLNLFRKRNSNQDHVHELIKALRAIKRSSLANKIDEMVAMSRSKH